MKAFLKLKIILIILIILLLGINSSVLADKNNDSAANSDQNNSPKYQVTRPHAVIKVNPLDDFSNNQNQKNMEVSWHNGNQDSDQDLEFTLNEELVLTSSDKSNGIAHGFISRNIKSSNEIPAEKILISVNGGKYQSFNQKIKVLYKNKMSSKLKFKIDEDWLRSKWTTIPAGVYKADIDVNLDRQGNKPELQVIIESVAVISLPENESIDLAIDDPTKNKRSNSLSWKVNSNVGSYQVEFKSEGIQAVKKDKQEKKNVKYKKEDNFMNYKSFFKYSINDNHADSFAPGESKTITTENGELRLNYSPGKYDAKNKPWYALLAGDYKDKITITVSAD